MLEKYNVLRQEFLSKAELFIDSKLLDELKLYYMRNIDSKRKLSKVADLQTLIRLLEKRNIVSYDQIEPLRYISKRFITDPSLESKLQDYENWVKTMPQLHLYNMYQSDEGKCVLHLYTYNLFYLTNLYQNDKAVFVHYNFLYNL